MVLAHSLGTGGPDIELLLLAAVMVILGVVFFFQEAVKPLVSVLLVVLGLGAAVFAFVLGGEEQSASQPVADGSGVSPGGASVEITSPSEGDVVPANQEIEIEYRVDPGDLPPEELGDMHVYIDGQLDSMQVEEVLTVEVPDGTHTLAVEAAQPNHASYDPPIIDEIEVTAE
ncbi:MAG: hypothetical protein M3124_02915 [Actinomycetota bacterium]|nr:hypothetical protein [Actinomycetota bacterium]